MPRGSFLDASKGGGLGFQEGYVLIERSYSTVFQFPPNSKTNEQSDAFCALIWEGTKLDSEWNELPGDDNGFQIINRMGGLDQVRPGKLVEKDFDNLDVEPEDLGNEVGVVGNSFVLEADAKFHQNWGKVKDSLEKYGFKSEVLGRGIATDFVGMAAHFKTVEGAKYIAKKGKSAGQEVTPTHLECDRIHTYPYDAKKKGAVAGKTSTAAAGGKTNGAAAGGGDDAVEAAKTVFGKLSAEFKKEVVVGKDVDRAVFQKALTKELMRQKINPKVQKSVMDLVKDDEKLVELAMALVDQAGAFSTDGATVTFA